MAWDGLGGRGAGRGREGRGRGRSLEREVEGERSALAFLWDILVRPGTYWKIRSYIFRDRNLTENVAMVRFSDILLPLIEYHNLTIQIICNMHPHVHNIGVRGIDQIFRKCQSCLIGKLMKERLWESLGMEASSCREASLLSENSFHFSPLRIVFFRFIHMTHGVVGEEAWYGVGKIWYRLKLNLSWGKCSSWNER